MHEWPGDHARQIRFRLDFVGLKQSLTDLVGRPDSAMLVGTSVSLKPHGWQIWESQGKELDLALACMAVELAARFKEKANILLAVGKDYFYEVVLRCLKLGAHVSVVGFECAMGARLQQIRHERYQIKYLDPRKVGYVALFPEDLARYQHRTLVVRGYHKGIHADDQGLPWHHSLNHWRARATGLCRIGCKGSDLALVFEQLSENDVALELKSLRADVGDAAVSYCQYEEHRLSDCADDAYPVRDPVPRLLSSSSSSSASAPSSPEVDLCDDDDVFWQAGIAAVSSISTAQGLSPRMPLAQPFYLRPVEPASVVPGSPPPPSSASLSPLAAALGGIDLKDNDEFWLPGSAAKVPVPFATAQGLTPRVPPRPFYLRPVEPASQPLSPLPPSSSSASPSLSPSDLADADWLQRTSNSPKVPCARTTQQLSPCMPVAPSPQPFYLRAVKPASQPLAVARSEGKDAAREVANDDDWLQRSSTAQGLTHRISPQPFHLRAVKPASQLSVRSEEGDAAREVDNLRGTPTHRDAGCALGLRFSSKLRGRQPTKRCAFGFYCKSRSDCSFLHSAEQRSYWNTFGQAPKLNKLRPCKDGDDCPRSARSCGFLHSGEVPCCKWCRRQHEPNCYAV